MIASFFKLALLTALLVLFSITSGCLKRNSGNGPDIIELVDTDKDGEPNIKDNDIDGDNIINENDDDIDGDDIINSEDDDIDGDNIDNIDDNDIDGDGIININDPDIDGDGIININDPDIDGDGIDNIDDNDIDGDGIPNTEDDDIDGDGTKNDNDTDLDGDGIINSDDNDIDGDGIENNNDDDIDGDGILNDDDAIQGGTGNDIDGTEGATNDGTDKNEGTTNDGADNDIGETGDDDPVSGLVVVAVDTVGFSLSLDNAQANQTISQTKLVDLDETREGIKDNDIAVSTFSMTDLKIVSAQSNSFVAANSDTRVVVTLSFMDGSEKVPVLGTLEQDGVLGSVITVGQLGDGLVLNDQLFADIGFDAFNNLIKDESRDSVETIVDITFLDEPNDASTELAVDFILKTSGKKPM
jgi:hypothetical protein